MSRPIGLAAQAIPGLAPWRTVEIAGAAGFDRVGVLIEPETWTVETTRRVRHAAKDCGIVVQDAEVVRLGTTAEPERLLDIAAEIGAAYVITISQLDEPARAIDLLAGLVRHGGAHGVTPVFEFGRFSSVATLDAALAIAAAAGAPILVDPLHLARSGGHAADLACVPAAMLPYVQICDAGPPPADMTRAALLAEAREARRDLGTGMLDLNGFIAALPADLVLMNECRSLAMARAWPDPLDHARVLAATMRRWLAAREDRA